MSCPNDNQRSLDKAAAWLDRHVVGRDGAINAVILMPATQWSFLQAKSICVAEELGWIVRRGRSLTVCNRGIRAINACRRRRSQVRITDGGKA